MSAYPESDDLRSILACALNRLAMGWFWNTCVDSGTGQIWLFMQVNNRVIGAPVRVLCLGRPRLECTADALTAWCLSVIRIMGIEGRYCAEGAD